MVMVRMRVRVRAIVRVRVRREEVERRGTRDEEWCLNIALRGSESEGNAIGEVELGENEADEGARLDGDGIGGRVRGHVQDH